MFKKVTFQATFYFFITFICRRNADACRQNVGISWTLSFICDLHQCHIWFLYLTFKRTAYVFFLQYDIIPYFGDTLDQDETGKKKGSG